jgi:hypothetical protein
VLPPPEEGATIGVLTGRGVSERMTDRVDTVVALVHCRPAFIFVAIVDRW